MTKVIYIKLLLLSIFAAVILLCSLQYYNTLRNYYNPSRTYGDWVETNTPNYLAERITFNSNGVYRNNLLVTTKFEFDGEIIIFTTGRGTFIYQMIGAKESPKLRRVTPDYPPQHFLRDRDYQ